MSDAIKIKKSNSGFVKRTLSDFRLIQDFLSTREQPYWDV